MVLLGYCSIMLSKFNHYQWLISPRGSHVVPVWNCELWSPRTEMVGPCSIAAAEETLVDDLLTSLIGMGVNGVNELPTEFKPKNKQNQKLGCKQKWKNKKNKKAFNLLT